MRSRKPSLLDFVGGVCVAGDDDDYDLGAWHRQQPAFLARGSGPTWSCHLITSQKK